MLDMGFLPDIKRVLRHIPDKRQTLFFSATMPAPIAKLAQEMLVKPVTVNLERQGAPAGGISQAIYPVSQALKSSLLLHLIKAGAVGSVLVFTRTKHRANRLAEFLTKQGVKAERIHGNRSQAQRTQALAGFKDGTYQVLVATDIAARGIDVTALKHVINFDVPMIPEDYVHRVGRTGRAEETGDAFTFVSPEEENELRAIERAVAKRLPRVTLPDFDYTARTTEKLEIPLAERIAAIRANRAQARANAAAKAARRSANGQHGQASSASHATSSRSGATHPKASTHSASASHGDKPHGAGPSSDGGGQRRRRRPRGRRPPPRSGA